MIRRSLCASLLTAKRRLGEMVGKQPKAHGNLAQTRAWASTGAGTGQSCVLRMAFPWTQSSHN
jgi:hypothetical protein